MGTHHVSKFKLIVRGEEIPDIFEVTGLKLGEDGEVTAHEPDREISLNNGKRILGKIGVRFYLKDDKKTLQYFYDWYQNKGTDFRDVAVVITDVSNQEELYRYVYEGCEIGNWTEEDKTRESPAAELIAVELKPKEIRMVLV